MKVTDIYYFSGTHWDREWYQTFQGFRLRLVKMTDELIDYLENNSDFGVFHFDGQTIVLEDYNEIAPENAQRLKKLIGDGRIKVGPWYNMPDEFLVSGESLIKNLNIGKRLAEKWGAEPWNLGYICDIFGHIAQTPQIFNGFGIKSALLGRGTNEDDDAFFVWQAPDGSECITFKLEPDNGYGSFCQAVVEKDVTDKEELKKLIKNYVDSEIQRSNSNAVILMDALDHRQVHKNTPEYLKIIKELYPDVNVHHCDLGEAFLNLSDKKNLLPVKEGELNKTSKYLHGYLHLITDTLSSYYTHKKANDECQNMLEKIAAPMTAFASVEKMGLRRSYLDLAYKYLLQNHPHDSICGCSIEQVHKDMVYRFDQVREICNALTEEFLHLQNPPQKEGDYLLRLYNTLPFERDECVTVDFVLDDGFPNRYSEPFGYEQIACFKIVNSRGEEIPYQIANIRREYRRRIYNDETEAGELYTVTFQAVLPPCGYADFKIIPDTRPVRYLEKMTSGRDFAENDQIRMEISQDGEISLYNKKTGQAYNNLVSFADDGEIGDGWFHVNPINDKVIYSKGTGCRIEKIEDGPSRCVFSVRKTLEIPSRAEDLKSGKERSREYVNIPIVIEAGLSKGSAYADISVRIDNRAKDHRLKLLLPTGIERGKYFAGQAFYCNERKTGIDYATGNWREHERYEKQMNGIAGKRDNNQNGLAFVSAAGLHECAGLDDGTLAVTLLRAFGTTVMTAGEDGGQLLGELNYRFLLVPLDKDISYSDLVKYQDSLAARPLVSFTKTNNAPEEKSYMRLEGNGLNLSVLKLPEDAGDNAVIVRVYNASDKTEKGFLEFSKNIKNAYEVMLNEDVIGEIQTNGGRIDIELSPRKIGTYRVVFN